MKKNLKVPLLAVQAAYEQTDKSGKEILEILFPGQQLKPLPIMERVKTWEDILAISGEQLTIANPVTDRQVALNAIEMMMIARDVISEGWEPDYNDTSEAKWEVVYKWDGSGFGFSGSSTDDWDASTSVGARLVFETKEKAKFFATVMINAINQFLIKNYNQTKNEN